MRSSLRVFEHQLLKIGHPLACEGPPQRLQQCHIDALAQYNERHGSECFKLGYRSVTTTQFVGYIEVGDLSIEILPKADRSSQSVEDSRWRDALLEMLRVAMGLDLWTPTPASQNTTRATLMDLVAARFVTEVETLEHAGLARSYREDEANGAVLRGKLMFPQHVRQNAVRADRFFVRYTTFDPDITVNRILLAALIALSQRPLSGSLPGRVRAALTPLADLTSITVTAQTFERLQYGRSTARYRSALILARMILEQLSPSLRSGRAPVFALLFDMNRLWERYVSAILRRLAGPRWEVSTQERLPFWGGNSTMRRVRPDIVIRDAETKAVRVVADTKWKLSPDGMPADADLKQMFVYNELLASERAVLIYPGTEGSQARSASFETKQHRCESMHVPVPARGQSHDALAALFS